MPVRSRSTLRSFKKLYPHVIVPQYGGVEPGNAIQGDGVFQCRVFCAPIYLDAREITKDKEWDDGKQLVPARL